MQITIIRRKTQEELCFLFLKRRLSEIAVVFLQNSSLELTTYKSLVNKNRMN